MTWSGTTGTLAGSVPGVPGERSTVVSKFKWLEGTTWHDEPARTVKTGACADPGIAIDKDGPATAYAGDRATFTYAVRNTGNVTLSSPEVTDDKCAPVTQGARRPGLVRPGRRLDLHVHHDDHRGDGRRARQRRHGVRDWGRGRSGLRRRPHTSRCAAREEPGGAGGRAGEPDRGAVAPATARSGRARLRGPGGCVRQAFRARVRGREIASVAFMLDGRPVKRIRGERASYAVRITPDRYGFGRHRIVARVRFTAESGTRALRLPLTFRRCAQGTVAPRFTG